MSNTAALYIAIPLFFFAAPFFVQQMLGIIKGYRDGEPGKGRIKPLYLLAPDARPATTPAPLHTITIDQHQTLVAAHDAAIAAAVASTTTTLTQAVQAVLAAVPAIAQPAVYQPIVGGDGMPVGATAGSGGDTPNPYSAQYPSIFSGDLDHHFRDPQYDYAPDTPHEGIAVDDGSFNLPTVGK